MSIFNDGYYQKMLHNLVLRPNGVNVYSLFLSDRPNLQLTTKNICLLFSSFPLMLAALSTSASFTYTCDSYNCAKSHKLWRFYSNPGMM